MAAFADLVCLGGVSELVLRDRGRPDSAGRQQFLHPLEMGPVARDAWPQHLHILARLRKTGRGGGDPDEAAVRLQDAVRLRLYLTADRVEYDIAIRDQLGEVLRV